MWWFFLLFSSHILSGSCVVVWHGSGDSVYDHVTAEFGVQSSHYNVTAPLAMIDSDPELCGTVLGDVLRDKIAVAKRGKCAFVDKALHALDAGATAVIVGNDEDNTLYRMVGHKGDRSVTIPAVFVGKDDYNHMVAFLHADAYTQQDTDKPNKTDTHRPQLDKRSTLAVEAGTGGTGRGGREEAVVVVMANVGSRGEVDGNGTMAYVLWVVQTATLVLACMGLLGIFYFAYRCCRQRVQRVERVDVARRLPLINYHRVRDEEEALLPGGTDDSSRANVHNGACAVCLEDFDDMERIKLLPCHHGFHTDCIDPWLQRSDLCPMCKASVLTDSDDPLFVEAAGRSRRCCCCRG